MSRRLRTLVVAMLVTMAVPALAQTLRIAATTTSLRTKPASDAPVVANLTQDAELSLIRREGSWYFVRVRASGVEGFVHSLIVETVSGGDPVSVPSGSASPPPLLPSPAPRAAAPEPATASAPVGRARNANWRRDLDSALEKYYPKASLNWTQENISKPGAVLLLMQPGVLAERTIFTNHVRNNVLQPPGTGGFLSDLIRQSQDDEAARDRVRLALYQPVYVTEVRVSDTSVDLEVATSRQFVYESVDRAAIARFAQGTSLKGDTLTKTDVSVRRASLVFEFPKDTLETMSFGDVIQVLDTMVLKADDPKAPQFGKVGLGMSRDQVIVNLGKPVNIVSLGDREILVYSNLKVTLVDGKVTDVQ